MWLKYRDHAALQERTGLAGLPFANFENQLVVHAKNEATVEDRFWSASGSTRTIAGMATRRRMRSDWRIEPCCCNEGRNAGYTDTQ